MLTYKFSSVSGWAASLHSLRTNVAKMAPSALEALVPSRSPSLAPLVLTHESICVWLRQLPVVPPTLASCYEVDTFMHLAWSHLQQTLTMLSYSQLKAQLWHDFPLLRPFLKANSGAGPGRFLTVYPRKPMITIDDQDKYQISAHCY